MGTNITGITDRAFETAAQAHPYTAEQKLQQADEFWAEHDRLYAEQMATVMGKITDSMAVAQEIARRMSSGAKVSPSDENHLMQYDSRMYMAVKNAQIMAQKKRDMSNESLVEKLEERHADDRKDWTSELNDKIAVMNKDSAAAGEASGGSFDISI